FTSKELIEVVDPTMLLNINEWNEMANKSDININEPYMICYFLKKETFSKEYELAQKLAKEKNLKLYYINQRFTKRSFYKNTICDAGPEDFVKLIKNAEFVCTDSFHGTIFSIMFRKDFYSLVDTENTNDQRRQNILEKLGLMDRCIYLDNIEFNNSNIDYENVQKEIEILRNNSKNFLINSLN
ncbi:polysaccharide pyruvyl transferase family protein, partial [Clostridium perfringens]